MNKPQNRIVMLALACLLLTACTQQPAWNRTLSKKQLDNPSRSYAWEDERCCLDRNGNWVEGSFQYSGLVWKSPNSVKLNGLYVTSNGDELWAVGVGGVILYSSDGGRTWSPQQSHTNQDLNAVYGASNGKELWVVGSAGTVRYSENKGVLWTSKILEGDLNLVSVSGTADGKKLWLIANRGETGTLEDSGKEIDAQWRNNDSIVMYSVDGGLNWKSVSSYKTRRLVSIFSSADGSRLWGVAREKYSTKDEAGEPTEDVRRVFPYSVDGGQTWNEPELLYGSFPSAIAIYGTADAERIWIVDGLGVISQSPDGTQSWNHQWPQPFTYATILGKHWTFLCVNADGSRLWAIGESGNFMRGNSSGIYPQIFEARLFSAPGEARLQFKLSPYEQTQPLQDLVVNVFGANELNHAENSYIRVVGKLIPPEQGADIWNFKFNPAQAGSRQGEKVYLKVVLDNSGYTQFFALPVFTYDSLWERYQNWIILTAAVILLLIFLTFLLFIRPLWLLSIYQKAFIYGAVEQIPSKPLAGGLKILLNGTLLPLFVHHHRTLDAWVSKYAAVVRRRFEVEPIVSSHPMYIPLPIRLGEPISGKLILEPAPKELQSLFKQKRTTVEIIGIGGSGKTSLALQVARWAMDGTDSEGLASHRMLPVLIEEEFSDPMTILQRKLNAWLNENVEPHLIKALLKKRRLLIIIDGVSERSLATQQHIRNIHGFFPINAMLLTSRLRVSLEAGDEIVMYLQSLTSSTLLYLLTALLSLMHNQPDGVAENQGHYAFSSIEEQLELGKRLAVLIQGQGKDLGITPLLVRLTVEKAVELIEKGLTLDDLPTSIPEVYFDYLRRVNPQIPGIPHGMSHDEMLQAAEIIGRLCLGNDFVPREVPKSQVRLSLAKKGRFDTNQLDPIQRLIENGVLVERASGTDTFLRFTLDPVTEFLGAMAWARYCGSDPDCWQDLESRLSELGEIASGFRVALHLTRKAYGREQGWLLESIRNQVHLQLNLDD